MNSVERVKQLCKERKIPISHLEKACGFSNGYIRGLKEGNLPSNRISLIADYLNVSIEYLLTGEQPKDYYLTPETVKAAREIFENEELKKLFDDAIDATPEDLRTVHSMLLALKRKNR